MDYNEVRELLRWVTKDVDGAALTDGIIQRYIIEGQRFITDSLRMGEHHVVTDMTYTADADSVTMPTTVAWVYHIEIHDDGEEVPVPIMTSDDTTGHSNQGTAYYAYIIGRNVYIRTDGDAPSEELSLKLFCTPLLSSSSFAWTDVFGTAAGSLPEHHAELLVTYLHWKLRLITARIQAEFLIAREWKAEFFSDLSFYVKKREGVGRKDTQYTTRSIGVLE